MTDTKKLNKHLIWTTVLNGLIVIGAGHGIAPLGLLEFFWFPYLGSDELTFSFSASYDDSLGLTALLSLAGQLILITSIFFSNHIKLPAVAVGSFFLLAGFYNLTHGLFHNGLAQFSFLTGIPFLISISLVFTQIRRLKN